MFTCDFCGLPADSLTAVYSVSVCVDCTELAEIAYEPETL